MGVVKKEKGAVAVQAEEGHLDRKLQFDCHGVCE